MKKVKIFTDGACSGNPGPGGWGAILKYESIIKEISGFDPETTNNRMELTAIIRALELLKWPCEVFFYSDSQYIINALCKNWLYTWEKNGWKRAKNKDVLNIDLWKIFINLYKMHKIKPVWIKGHSGHLENERCDVLATNAIKNINNY
ncbi:MAG: ribonuclease HI [Candidatus Improbicoccus devescovinae]|nr:MAG: ribonuclease HI [Candidatus Improbicoccus devescovinae]